MDFRHAAIVVSSMEEATQVYLDTINNIAMKHWPKHTDHLEFIHQLREFINESDTSPADSRYLLSLVMMYEQSRGVVQAKQAIKK